MKRSLRQKIITWFLVPTAIILVMVAVVTFYAYQRVTESLVIDRDRELTRLSASLLAAELASYTDPLAEQYLAGFDGWVVFGADGTVIAAEPAEYEARNQAWFRRILPYLTLRPSEPIYLDMAVNMPEGEKIIVVVMPITSPGVGPAGGVAGFFVLGSSADTALSRSVEKLQREGKTIYLVDGNSRVIYHSTPDFVGDNWREQPPVEQVTGGKGGALRTRDLSGQEIVASFAPVPGTPWGLVMEESWAALSGSSRRYGQFLLLLLALGVVAPTALVATGLRRITGPIAELDNAARRIAGGDLSQRIRVSSGDELEELAGQFNLMAAKLRESRAHLERKVADRTKELATLNKIATEVSHSLDLGEILGNALDEILAVMRIEKGQAFRLDREGQCLVLIAQRGFAEGSTWCAARLPLGTGAVGRAVEEGRPVVIRAPYPPGDEFKESLLSEGIQCAISIPLITKGGTVGVVNVATGKPRLVTAEDLALLTAIGHQIGIAVENALLYEQAQRLAVVEERNRLARDLHDSMIQALYGVTLYAEAAGRKLAMGNTEATAEHLRRIQATSQEALREMRLLIFELRPLILRVSGLATALQARLEGVEGRVGLETEFRGDGVGQLPLDVEEGLYRIAQEALNNVLRHAHAKHVLVSLQQIDHLVVLEVADDGVGFDPEAVKEQCGFGLQGMEERAARLGGKLIVQSRPGTGTTIKVEVCQS
ncbi:MAG: GAF domain-containing protein [Anaerolineae bacterium]|nr:GAF domain-containing protein [Anaerolineae bacterium]